MGSNIIAASAFVQNNSKHLELSEIEKLCNEDEYLTEFSPYVSSTKKVKYGREEKSYSIDGVNSQYVSLRSKKIEFGRNIEYVDEQRFQKVCLIGNHVMTDLFGEDADGSLVLGEYLRVAGSKYKIVGILKEISESQFSDEDNMVLIPYTVAMKEFGVKYIGTWYFTYTDKEVSQLAADVVDKYFYSVLKDADNYILIDAQRMIDSMNSTIDTIKMVLVAIAGISLLVGGIGIMNIMLVSVTERTREIGIRKAIGANKRDVLTQFVIEAITTSGMGGLVGIGLGIFLVNTVSKAFEIRGDVGWDSILIASGISAFIGVIFGYLPANKAANLHPIDALRYE